MLRRGDRKDGKVFWAYAHGCKNGEYWISEEMFSFKKSKKANPRPLDQILRTRIKLRLRYSTKPEVREYVKKKAAERYLTMKDTRAFKAKRQAAHARRMTDPIQHLKAVCRARTWAAFSLKGGKAKKTQKLLGCEYSVLKSHIESLFTHGMNWENKGKWHIDHIIPLSSAKTVTELERLCHYKNLQPLWAIDNIKKGSKTNAKIEN